MSKVNSRNAKYKYTTSNNLKHLIAIKKAEKVAESGGAHILIRDIEEELATYCDVSKDTVLMIKRGRNQPSLAVAMKIAEYFKVPLEEVFTLIEE